MAQGMAIPPTERRAMVSCHPSFAKVVGPDATLRLLLREKDGVPLFHEAGVYLESSRSVYISSNRIYCPDGGRQKIVITRVPIDKIPSSAAAASTTFSCCSNPSTSILEPLQESNPEEFEIFSNAVTTSWHSLPSTMVMPNGATKWIQDDGTEAILWCEQGRHDLDGKGLTEVESSLVLYTQDGRTKTVLDSYRGKPFDSLNDVVVHRQSGLVFFTNPDYGIGQSFKKVPCKSHQYAPNGLYAWHPSSGQVRLIDDRYDKANGVTFVPDPSDPTSGKGLLVTTDTGQFSFQPNETMGVLTVEDDRPACIYTYEVKPYLNGVTNVFSCIDAKNRRLLGHSDCPVPDGIHPDELGNVWTGNGNGIHIWNPWERKLIGKILVPSGKGVANFCWAGPVVNESRCKNVQHPNGNGIKDLGNTKYRVLLFAEDELWEACVAVNGQD